MTTTKTSFQNIFTFGTINFLQPNNNNNNDDNYSGNNSKNNYYSGASVIDKPSIIETRLNEVIMGTSHPTFKKVRGSSFFT